MNSTSFYAIIKKDVSFLKKLRRDVLACLVVSVLQWMPLMCFIYIHLSMTLFYAMLALFVSVNCFALKWRTNVFAFRVICIFCVCILATVSLDNAIKIEFIVYLLFATVLQITTDIYLYFIYRNSRAVLPTQSDDSEDDIQDSIGT